MLPNHHTVTSYRVYHTVSPYRVYHTVSLYTSCYIITLCHDIVYHTTSSYRVIIPYGQVELPLYFYAQQTERHVEHAFLTAAMFSRRSSRARSMLPAPPRSTPPQLGWKQSGVRVPYHTTRQEHTTLTNPDKTSSATVVPVIASWRDNTKNQ